MGFTLANPEETTRALTRRQLLGSGRRSFRRGGFPCGHGSGYMPAAQRPTSRQLIIISGTRRNLCRAVLKETFHDAVKKYPPDFGLPPNATPEQRLRAFIHSFLLRIFSEGPSARHGKLMSREMVEPTGAMDTVVKENIRPMAVALSSIIEDLMGHKTDEKMEKRLCAMSVVSQVLFYHHCRPVVARMFPDMKFNAAAIEKLSEHITAFSLAGIQEMAKKGRK